MRGKVANDSADGRGRREVDVEEPSVELMIAILKRNVGILTSFQTEIENSFSQLFVLRNCPYVYRDPKMCADVSV